MNSIDLNADLGEGYGPWRMGSDDEMLNIVTSANVACGGHAGDPETMLRTLKLARERCVVIGAHPSYPDIQGFGRRKISFSIGEIEGFVAAQIGALMGVAALAGASVRYVKPHGALGNLAADESDVAAAIVRAVRAVDRRLAILAISGTTLEQVARSEDVNVFSEIFADRAYLENGRLVPRGLAGAVIDDPAEAAVRLLQFLNEGKMPTVDGSRIALVAHSICVHGDTKQSVEMAGHIRECLSSRKIRVEPFLENE